MARPTQITPQSFHLGHEKVVISSNGQVYIGEGYETVPGLLLTTDADAVEYRRELQAIFDAGRKDAQEGMQRALGLKE